MGFLGQASRWPLKDINLWLVCLNVAKLVVRMWVYMYTDIENDSRLAGLSTGKIHQTAVLDTPFSQQGLFGWVSASSPTTTASLASKSNCSSLRG